MQRIMLTCIWCYRECVCNLDGPNYCPVCRHRVDVLPKDCDCPLCSAVREAETKITIIIEPEQQEGQQ